VITALNAVEALERMREAEVDLVVTDIRMPGMDGLELAETLHARRPWTPVLIVTGYGTAADEARAKAAGVSAFLHKPLSPEMIEASTEPGAARNRWRSPRPRRSRRRRSRPRWWPRRRCARAGSRTSPCSSRRRSSAWSTPCSCLRRLGVLAWMGGKELAKRVAARESGGAVATAAKIVFMPLIGLAYVIVLPFAGIATLAWIAGRTLMGKEHAE